MRGHQVFCTVGGRMCDLFLRPVTFPHRRVLCTSTFPKFVFRIGREHRLTMVRKKCFSTMGPAPLEAESIIDLTLLSSPVIIIDIDSDNMESLPGLAIPAPVTSIKLDLMPEPKYEHKDEAKEGVKGEPKDDMKDVFKYNPPHSPPPVRLRLDCVEIPPMRPSLRRAWERELARERERRRLQFRPVPRRSVLTPPTSSRSPSPDLGFVVIAGVRLPVSQMLNTMFYWIHERHELFLRRLEGHPPSLDYGCHS
ncbi:hypothetical protein OPQ81_004175 [Rhizoctonia solani]|nr:hypothetical protein OPQ81_004175 [Rhizoctonia solani]